MYSNAVYGSTEVDEVDHKDDANQSDLVDVYKIDLCSQS
jgi:hypothetical protein